MRSTGLLQVNSVELSGALGPLQVQLRAPGRQPAQLGAHLLGGGQTVLGCAEDAADEAELLQSEPGHFGALLLFEEAADGQPPTAAAGPEEKDRN